MPQLNATTPRLFRHGLPAEAKLAVLVVLSLALLVGDSQWRVLEPVRRAVSVVLYPFQRAVLLPRDMVQQVSLSSCDFPKAVNEFVKAGFTPEPATLVRPPMVKESKVRIECRVLETKVLGHQAGSGNLVICEALRMHIDPCVLDASGRHIDQQRFQLVARLGADWYCRVGADNLFQVEKPNTKLGIGMDALPAPIRQSRILTGNHLGQLANVHEQPVVEPSFEDARLKEIFQYYAMSPEEMERELHLYAAELLDAGRVAEAWQVLLALN